jgi:hypothetical protein
VAALAVYLARFPFVDDIVKRPGMTSVMKGIGVYRVQPQRVALPTTPRACSAGKAYNW